MAVHGRKPGMHIQPPASSCALLASSVPATPQSPCNGSPSRLQTLRRKPCELPESAAAAALHAVPGGADRGSRGQACERAASVLQLLELHALSTHCSGEAAGLPSQAEQLQPQLRRSQRRRACTKQT